MNSPVIEIHELSKKYRLGVLGTGTLRGDIKRWWAAFNGREDPYAKLNADRIDGNKTHWALKDVSFSVNEGEVCGIIGKNGAGKSTLLKILSRVTTPTSGEIQIKGRIASLLEVGTGFHPELTGRENIFLNGAILGMTKAEIKSKFDQIVQFSGVEKYIDTPVKRYSSGMYVRLAFAVAAHLEPEILIIDEVLAVGDLDFQKKCLGKMKEVSGQGRTVLFVSHNMSAIKTLCSKAVYLQDGKLISTGTVSDVVNEYLSSNKMVAETGVIPDSFVRPYGTGEAKFKEVYLTGEQGNKTKELCFREKFGVTIFLECFQQVDHGGVSVYLSDVDGQVITFSSAGRPQYISRVFEKGIHRIDIQFDSVLMPRKYSIGVAFSHFKSGSVIDFLEYVYDFSVLPVGKPGEGDYLWSTVHGYIEPVTEWVFEKVK